MKFNAALTLFGLIFALLISSCNKESEEQLKIKNENQISSPLTKAYAPIWDFERMRLLPVNKNSLSDKQVADIAKILSNEPGTSQSSFTSAHEELFKMNSSDSEKCLNLLFDLPLNNLKNRELLLIKMKKLIL